MSLLLSVKKRIDIACLHASSFFFLLAFFSSFFKYIYIFFKCALVVRWIVVRWIALRGTTKVSWLDGPFLRRPFAAQLSNRADTSCASMYGMTGVCERVIKTVHMLVLHFSDRPQQAVWRRAGVLRVLQESAWLPPGGGHHALPPLVPHPHLQR